MGGRGRAPQFEVRPAIRFNLSVKLQLQRTSSPRVVVFGVPSFA
jgi:hypothetical protein